MVLVLLPGLDGTEIFLQPLLAALPEKIRPLVVTYPETGIQRYAHLLEVVRKAVDGIPAFHLLGWSFSGPLALMLAAAEPQRVRSVILSASFVRPPRPELSSIRFAVSGASMWLWRAARRLPLWLARPRGDAFRLAKSQTWRRIPARTLAVRMREVMQVDARAELSACRQPLLYLAASRDGMVPRRCAEEILRLRPATRLATIEGEHFAMYTNPRAAARAIAEFIA